MASIAFRANRAGVQQSIRTGQPVKIQFTATDFNIGSGFDVANSRFKPKKAGRYSVTAAAQFNAVRQGMMFTVFLYRNGAPIARFGGCPANGMDPFGASVTDVVALNGSSDVLEVWVQQSSGDPLNLDGTPSVSWFSGFQIA
jgi:hypothetical protein